jgi:ubiquitin C-terminal hydrolase
MDSSIKKYKYNFHLNHELVLPEENYKKKGLTGLANVGNTCFMNSALQCLSNTLKLTDYFLSHKFAEDIEDTKNRNKPEFKLLNSYINLLSNIWDTNQLLKPKTFLETLSIYITKYSRLEQQDSHEFLMYFLDIIHKAISYEVEIDISGNPKSKTDMLIKKSFESWKLFYEKDFSFLIETFNGMNYNKIECKNCDFIENVFEPYNTISLDITLPNSNSSIDLNTCLENYFQKNENINTWSCEKCKKNGCKKTSSCWMFPNYIIIQLKRFNKINNITIKNNKQVTFPMDDLNLTEYISKEKNDPNNYIYSLYAVNYHSGGLNGGHYWSCCKNLDDSWYLFNDGNVSKFNQNVENILHKDAYLLFYYRKFIKSKKE